MMRLLPVIAAMALIVVGYVYFFTELYLASAWLKSW